ncbi:MAG: M48 family metalloprotease [Candidatus Omnitrophota bacterium]
MLFLFIMAFSFSRPLRNIVSLFTGNSIIIITLYFFLFYAFYFIFSFPLKYYQGLVYIRANNFIDWFQTLFKKEVRAFSVLFFVIQVIYFFLETDVLWWWLPVAFLCIISRYSLELAPKYLAPLFLQSTALDSSEFKQRLIELVGRANIKVTNVFFLAQAKAEVVILGYGPVRKLMLSEKIRDYAPEEIEIIVAREAANHYYGHIRSKLIIEALVMLLVFLIVNIAFKPVAGYFGFEFIFDIETLPVLIGLFFIIFLLMALIQNSYFRSMDKQADIYALKMTQAPDAFISLLIRQQQNRDKLDIDYFVNQILNGNISDARRMALAQDYAQGIYAQEKGSKNL